jgi:hypothetical protein
MTTQWGFSEEKTSSVAVRSLTVTERLTSPHEESAEKALFRAFDTPCMSGFVAARTTMGATIDEKSGRLWVCH